MTKTSLQFTWGERWRIFKTRLLCTRPFLALHVLCGRPLLYRATLCLRKPLPAEDKMKIVNVTLDFTSQETP